MGKHRRRRPTWMVQVARYVRLATEIAVLVALIKRTM
jgi:hypothetical protein